MNAAVWLGATVFFSFAVGPALASDEVRQLLTPSYYPYYSRALIQVVATSYFHLAIACGVVALLHLLAQRLYWGRPPRRIVLGLAAGLFALALLDGNWLTPRLKHLHRAQYSQAAQPAERAAAARSFRTWHTVSQMLNVVMVAGLVLYVWHIANPPDPTRYVSSVKFRG